VLLYPNKAWEDRAKPSLTEFKVSDKNGVVTFKKSQPLFYRKHANMGINIFVWDVPGDRLVRIEPGEVVQARALRIKLPEVSNDEERS
jgi:hypothetical protein